MSLVEREGERAFHQVFEEAFGRTAFRSKGKLTTAEWLRFHVFERGEIAARAGLAAEECPYHRCRDPRIRELWMRGFMYGSLEGAM